MAVSPALAGEPPKQSAPALTLQLPVPDVALIVQTLGQIRCESVGQLETCNRALAVLRDIKEQAQKQER